MSPGQVPSTEALSPEGIAASLRAAGYAAGERFELCAFGGARSGVRSRWLRFDESGLGVASAWARRNDSPGGGLYLLANPLQEGAVPASPGGRPKDQHVANARALLIDLDPHSCKFAKKATKHRAKGALLCKHAPEFADPDDLSGVRPDKLEAAEAAALELQAFLAERLGVRVPLVDSGRGRQLWLVAAEDLPAKSRRALIAGLARRFDRPGLVEVDPSTHNPARLMRLPGGTNKKTGRRAQILDPGDGQPAPLERLLALIEELTPAEEERRARGHRRQSRTRSGREAGAARGERSPWTEAVLRVATIERVIADYGLGELDGRGRMACPIHGGSNPTSFSAGWDDTGDLWTCHSSCGTGDAIALLAGVRNVDRLKAREELAERYGVRDPRDEVEAKRPARELPRFPSGRAPVLAEGAVRTALADHFRAALRGGRPAPLLAATPTGDGKTHETLRELILASAERRREWLAEGRSLPALLSLPRHDLIEDVLDGVLPRVLAEIGGREVSRRTREDPEGEPITLEVVVEVQGQRVELARRTPALCDDRLGRKEAARRASARNRCAERRDSWVSSCSGCRFLKPSASKAAAAHEPSGGWCRTFDDLKTYAERAKPGGADVLLSAHESALRSSAPEVALHVVDESLAEQLVSAEEVSRADVEGYSNRLSEVDYRSEDLGDELVSFGVALDCVLQLFDEPPEPGIVAPFLPPPSEDSPTFAAQALSKVGAIWERTSRAGGPNATTKNLTHALAAILQKWAAGEPARVLIERGRRGLVAKVAVPLGVQAPTGPWANLDATNDPDLAARLGMTFGEEVRGFTGSRLAERGGLRVVQLVDARASMTALVKGEDAGERHARAAARAVRLQARLAPDATSVGIVTHKDCEGAAPKVLRKAFKHEGLPAPERIDTLHWGGLTGSNALKGCEVLHVFGDRAVPDEALRQAAIVLAPGATDAELCEERKHHHALVGEERVSYFGFLPDSPMGLAWRLLALAEVAQAVGRGTRGGTVARLIVVHGGAPFPLPLPVERVTARDLALDDDRERELAFLAGAVSVLPELSAKAATRLLGGPARSGQGRAALARRIELARSDDVRRRPRLGPWGVEWGRGRALAAAVRDGSGRAEAIDPREGATGFSCCGSEGAEAPSPSRSGAPAGAKGGRSPNRYWLVPPESSWEVLLGALSAVRSRASLAASLGVSRTSVGYWILGERTPSAKHQETLSELARDAIARDPARESHADEIAQQAGSHEAAPEEGAASSPTRVAVANTSAWLSAQPEPWVRRMAAGSAPIAWAGWAAAVGDPPPGGAGPPPLDYQIAPPRLAQLLERAPPREVKPLLLLAAGYARRCALRIAERRRAAAGAAGPDPRSPPNLDPLRLSGVP